MQFTIAAAAEAPDRRTLVIMGVSGSGKTEISQAVARLLGWPLIEADHFHSAENVERMRAGTPLSDFDRIHWLDALAVEMRAYQTADKPFVLACSALKRNYRARLCEAVPGLQFAYLQIDHSTAMQRVGSRPGHFMPTSLVDSQFATLEPPTGEDNVLTVDAAQSREQVSEQICAWACRDSPEEGVEKPVDLPANEFDSAIQAAHLTGETIYSGWVARFFDRLTDGLMAALMAFMVAAVFANVVLRYALGTGWAGAEELSRLAFVWLVFVGVASSMRRGELMRFNMIRDRFPQAARRLIDSASWLLVAGASVLAALGAWQQAQYGWGNHSTVVGYPVVLGMFPVLACMGALTLLALLQLFNVWRRPEPLPVANTNITAD